MDLLARFVSGRRTKWLVVVIWIVAVVALSPAGGKLADATTDDTESFLPKNAESTQVVRALKKDFPGGETQNGLIVYERDGGLSVRDREKILEDAAAVDRELPLVRPPVVPFAPGSPAELVSRNRSVAYTVVTLPNDFDKAADWGKEVRKTTGDGGGGLSIYLTGDLGFNTDAEEVFGEIDTKLLLVTVILVLVLLGAIYRSPAIAIMPLIVVGVSYTVAQGLIYLYSETGAEVSSNATSILVVLMFGVGTDYCLLLVSRYREELHRFEDKHDAMRRAHRRVGPAILASGLTVSLAMLVLLVADTGSIHSLGPVSAIGVTSAWLAGLTLLPAMLTIGGRNGFWPRRRSVACDPSGEFVQREGLWRRIGDRVLARPGAALGVTTLVFVVAAFGLLAYQESYSTTGFFKKKVQSVEGFRVIEKAFPPGALSPTTVVVTRADGPIRPADLEAAEAKLEKVGDVAGATATGLVSRDKQAAIVDVVLDSDPLASRALSEVPELRAAVRNVAPGVTAIVGGGSAINYDFNESTDRDLKMIIPLALAVIAVILAILLWAIVAPLVLIASVMLGFLGTLGISMLIIRFVVGDVGVDNSLPTFAFIFLVALGVDYTIFLMSRVREEARTHGTREGTLRAISATGPVITSAGIILAGTFSVLMTLPVTFTFNLGLIVALGILLDTFVVRTIMVPAAIELIGDKVWWPSDEKGGGHILLESSEDDPAT